MLSQMGTKREVSVVVPLLYSESYPQKLFESLLEIPAVTEILLCFGHDEKSPKHQGSTESCLYSKIRESAAENPRLKKLVRIAIGKKNKAAQLNLGINLAHNEIIWCLHADSFVSLLSKELPTPLGNEILYGSLRFAESVYGLMRLNEIGVKVRCKYWGMPFGDQGFMFTKSLIERLGFFNESVTLGESHELSWRAANSGVDLKLAQYRITTSARKYINRGWVRTTTYHVFHTFKQIWAYRRIR